MTSYTSGLGLSTAGSLDLGLWVLDDSLLSESLTLSSLSSSTSSTPPIPAGCMVPLATIIGHHEGPTMLRLPPSRKTSKATLTSPTPPRLRTMLKEKLLVETWLDGVAFDSSDHTPWGGIDTAEPICWKSEGSIYSPQAFKTKMALARRHDTPEPKDRERTPTISITGPSAPSRRSSNRNALVFEREIILRSGGQSTRLSLQASSNAMDPGVAEMISELQDLNTFFKEQEANARPTAPPPPSLIVSNSHFSLPVSLESSGNLTPGVPLALAARRGKKMLPPLSLRQSSAEDDEYPSMPTAFLGSPSTYSPQFEFASHPNRPSMDLQQMVTSLRSQCASIDSDTPPDGARDRGAGREEDEWAFADGLLDKYSSRRVDSDFVKKPLRADMVDYAEESLTNSPSPSTRPGSINAPPSTPLPPRPSQRTSVRSILKSSKSVRFASLPNDRPDSIEISPVVAPRRSLGPSSPPSRRPLPTRPRSHSTARSTIPAPLRSPPLKSTPARRRLSDPKRAKAPTVSSPSASPASSPAVPQTATPTRMQPKKALGSGRHSLSRVFASTSATKENKPSSPNSPTDTPPPSRSRWTLNENVLRRASIAVPGPQTPTPTSSPAPTQKTRMPVPLRNILTRFK
ncbi:hypothetical protein C8R47DRAFT_504531 [Mycena vitilis]|nr:hypothetical protein C8R47DRAFT_504531 [Mycena vitilis]